MNVIYYLAKRAWQGATKGHVYRFASSMRGRVEDQSFNLRSK